MSNFVEYNGEAAFHPGGYIKEYIDELGMTQEDFAYRLGTTPKNISCIIRGKQSISKDIATKLSKVMGTSVELWLNLQNKYDQQIAKFNSLKEVEEEKKIFQSINYKYFKDNFNLPNLPKKTDEQIEQLRVFLGVSSLTVLKNKDMYVRFRSSNLQMNENNLIKANIMTQIATNIAIKEIYTPKFDKDKFEEAVDYCLALTTMEGDFYPLIKDKLYQAGVNFVVLPNLEGSKINGATKKIKNHIMLMVNDRNNYSDTFWFTLLHEMGHIMYGDYGMSFADQDEVEDKANTFAENKLIPLKEYKKFVEAKLFDAEHIKEFANKINRDPGIVLGRLLKDKYISYNSSLQSLRKKYTINHKIEDAAFRKIY